MTGYCVVQRKTVEIKNPQEFTMKNGRPAVKGECAECVNRVLVWKLLEPASGEAS